MDTEKNNGCAGCGSDCPAAVKPLERKQLPDDVNRLKWWLEHSRKQTAVLWDTLGDYLDEKAQTEILVKLGRNCAESLGWAKSHIGDPEGFFQMIHDRWGEVATYDRDANVITIVTRERDCDCLLVSSCNINPVYCNCSIGWQQYTYETIFGKKVSVTVEKAVLRGDRRCVFRVQVSDEALA